ncbi:conserved Plasmodium protein, unknown function [Plasmodium ovale]|uniref:Uncharacterized protein n=2 Tax=Plasmodium ovale TaxID=36330 RepID=A0A1A8VWT4_PLAOA|nr:conserved Plasmodium protein, unknown function [Plasmodium ovale curtisi]SBS98967.1 conserved Plasmodium protein, unknown function [Plasmodium ovale curtisi]SCP04640.1 conserved Plasmodium protein, unknown function [Plasmodium ovale]
MECFLFDNTALTSVNTFAIMNSVVKIINSRWDNPRKRQRKKKTLYLTNRRLTEVFPPDYGFILKRLNMLLSDNNKSSKIFENTIDRWTIKKVRDYRRGYIKNKNYFKIHNKCKITEEELKSILKNIHIKYIDDEKYIIKLLYKLNESKKYNFIFINLAFFFVKDKIKINTYIETLFIPTWSKNCQEISSLLHYKKDVQSSDVNKKWEVKLKMERELCDAVFYKNIMNIHFHYSFFANFFEHLNGADVLSFMCSDSGSSGSSSAGDNRGRILDNSHTLVNPLEERSNGRQKSSDSLQSCMQNGSAKESLTMVHTPPHGISRVVPPFIPHGLEQNWEKHCRDEMCRNGKTEDNGGCFRERVTYIGEESSNNGSNNRTVDNTSHANRREENASSLGATGDEIIPNSDRNCTIPAGDFPPVTHDNLLGSGKNDFLKRNKTRRTLKSSVCIFDILPKSDMYKKMYMNMVSMYFSYAYLIS